MLSTSFSSITSRENCKFSKSRRIYVELVVRTVGLYNQTEDRDVWMQVFMLLVISPGCRGMMKFRVVQKYVVYILIICKWGPLWVHRQIDAIFKIAIEGDSSRLSALGDCPLQLSIPNRSPYTKGCQPTTRSPTQRAHSLSSTQRYNSRLITTNNSA